MAKLIRLKPRTHCLLLSDKREPYYWRDLDLEKGDAQLLFQLIIDNEDAHYLDDKLMPGTEFVAQLKSVCKKTSG